MHFETVVKAICCKRWYDSVYKQDISQEGKIIWFTDNLVKVTLLTVTGINLCQILSGFVVFQSYYSIPVEAIGLRMI